jgi:hypothetical protein
MDVACPRCRRLSPPDHRFCGYCGASLESVEAVEKGAEASETVVTAGQEMQRPDQPKRRVSGLGCGVIGGLVLGGAILVSEVSRDGSLSVDAAVRFVFNVCFYGCIAAAIGYGIARAWKRMGYSLLALVLFLVLWFAFWLGLP